MNKKIPPEAILRGAGLVSLIAWGSAVIYRVSHPGYLTEYGSQLHDTVTYFFMGFCFFGLFYLQYMWIPKLLKRPLNAGLGFAQAWICIALLLFGILPVWAAKLEVPARFSSDSMLITLAVIGEALFVVNVCWILLQPATAIPIPVQQKIVPVAAQAPALGNVPLGPLKKYGFDLVRWIRPENPMEMFGTTAIFLFVGGLLMWVVLPSSQFRVEWAGERHFLPMAMLWWAAALPFGIFSLMYWFHGGKRSLPYDRVMTRVHFGVAMLGLFDLVRLAIHLQIAMLSSLQDMVGENYWFEVYVIFGAALLLFFANVRAAKRVTAK